MRHVVIVGNGMVGHRLCERLREETDSDGLRITVFVKEVRPAYDRVHLRSFFSGIIGDRLLDHMGGRPSADEEGW